MSDISTSLFRPIVIVPTAFLFLLAAAAMGWYALNAHSDKIESNSTAGASVSASVSVLFSASDIARGQILTRSDLVSRSFEPRNVPKGALQSAADVDGHMAVVPISANTPILASNVSPNALIGISTHVPVGYRAYALPVSEADIAGGFLQVGDRVDLYMTLPGALFNGRNATGQAIDDQSKSALLLQSVEVLAVGTKLQTKGDADTSARTVTLAVPSEALAKVALASRLGRISFAIRNPVDDTQTAVVSANLRMLIGVHDNGDRRVPRQAAAPAVGRGITVYAGADRSLVRVP